MDGFAAARSKADLLKLAPNASGSSTPTTPQQATPLESHHEHTIEQMFAKLKALLRKAAERTVEATWRRIGALLQTFTPQECANYFRNAGYASI
jgi:transposase